MQNPAFKNFIRKDPKLFTAISLVVVLGILLLLILFFSVDPSSKNDTIRNSMITEAGKTLLQLIFVGVGATLVKYIFDSHVERQKKPDNDMSLRKSIWRDLREVFGKIEGSRTIMRGAMSAKTY